MAKISPEKKAEIRADKEAGLSTKEIAEKHGVNTSTINRHTRPDVDLAQRASMFEPAPDHAPQAATLEHPVLAKLMTNLDEPVRAQLPELPRGDPSELVQKILLNAESFPEVFPHPPSIDSLVSKSVRELTDVLASMETSRAVRMLTVQMKQFFLVGSRAVEVAGKTYLNLKTEGLTDGLIAQQKELDYLFRELAIKHSKKFGKAMEPEARLLMLFGVALLQTDAANRMRSQTTEPSTAEKFSDL